MDVHIKVVEGTVYRCGLSDMEALLSEEQWNALDLSKQYRIVNGTLEEASATPPAPVPPPLPLALQLSSAGVGPNNMLELLWDYAVAQGDPAITAKEATRQAVIAQYNADFAAWEAGQ